MPETVVVVPCYNEEARLDLGAFASVEVPDAARFLFVDDGSSDGTKRVLEEIVSTLGSDRASLLALPQNCGKAEAVRLGMVSALDARPFAVGFWDADLSTPLREVERFIQVLRDRPETIAVIGSRIRLMGRKVERNEVRHYAGRVFATMASVTLGFPVYDTQCGAKLFRATDHMREVLDQRFRTRWTFDVELLARLATRFGRDLGTSGVVVELPLTSWTDVPGSKVRLRHLPGMVRDLLRISLLYPKQ